MKILSRALLAVCLATSAFSQEIVTTVEATALPRATFTELASIPFANTPREIEQRAMLPQFRYGLRDASTSATLTPTTHIAPPPITRTFDSGGERGWVPADASGAVGRTHIVSALNSGIFVHDRDGKILSSATLKQFWNSSAADGSFYDPRVAYDLQNDRWIIVCIFDERSMMLAYSETSDPTGAWRRFTIEQNGADYSALALTKDTVVFTSCYGLSYNEGTDVYAIQKDALYASTSNLNVQKTEFIGRIGIMPVRADESMNESIVDSLDSTIFYRRLDANGQQFQTVVAPDAWYGDYFDVPQLSGPYLFAGWGQTDTAVDVNGTFYVVGARVHAQGNRSSIVWCKFDPINPKSEWGSIDDSTGTLSYAYPSLAVNKSGELLIGFGVFSKNSYPSSGYVFRDLLGRMSTFAMIRNGTSPFTGADRWGDYTSTDVDPLDNRRFWTLQMHCANKTFMTTWSIIDVRGSTKRRAVRD